jgi:transcription-repair coupling factor (superfamily II helicase)
MSPSGQTPRRVRFANPAGLVDFITAHAGTVKLRPDHRLVFMRAWDEPKERRKGARYFLGN